MIAGCDAGLECRGLGPESVVSVTVLARFSGRRRGQRETAARKPLGRFCTACMEFAQWTIRGGELLLVAGEGRAGR